MIALDQIKQFEIESTNYCNAKCPGCMRSMYPISDIDNNHLRLDQIEKLTAQLPDPKKIFMYFGGSLSEPMMNPYIYEILEHCCIHYDEVEVDTNASVGKLDTWIALGKLSKEYKNLVFNFSIDGLKDTNHIYRINTDFDKIMRNLETYIAYGGIAWWKFIVFVHNQHQVEQARQKAISMGCEGFKHMIANRGPDDILIKQDKKMIQYNEEEILYETEIVCKTKKKNFLYIDNRFNLMPCCHLRGSNSEIKVNLNEISLVDALQYQGFKDIENGWNTDDCNFVCKMACGKKRQLSLRGYNEQRISSNQI